MQPFRKTALPGDKASWIQFRTGLGQSVGDAISSWEQFSACDAYENDVYWVQVDKKPPHQFANAEVWVLWVYRFDGSAIRNRRDLGAIKDALVGPHVEAVELFPSESRLADAANRTALFCFLSVNGVANPPFPVGPMKAGAGYFGQH